MKKILLFLFLLPLFVVGQNRFPSIDSAKNYSLRYVKNSAVESFTNLRMQNVVYGTLQLLDSLCGAGVIDTIWKSGDTLKYRIGTQTVIVGVFGGSGSTPTLQQVTDQGNSTTDSINIIASSGERVGIFTKENAGPGANGKIVIGSSFATYKTELGPTALYFRNGSIYTSLAQKNNPATQNNSLALPDSSGTLPLRVKLNSTTYAPENNGTIDLGTTDTATVVKAYVTNAESVTITKGQVVYIFGASGDRASVKLAKNTSDTFSSKTLGIVRADIAAGQAGWITTQGQVSGINLGAYTPGDILWLDSIAGGFTATKPQAPYHAVFLGVVERANVGNGLIYVKPQNGVELDELHDVRITSLANNDVIRYNSSLGYWENKSIVTTSGIQWQGVDSAIARDDATYGYHHKEEFRSSITYASGAAMSGSYWNNNLVSGGTAALYTEAGLFGGIQIGTGVNAAGGNYLLGSVNYDLSIPATDYIVIKTRIKIDSINDGTQRYNVQIGLVGQVNTINPSSALLFNYSLQGDPTGSASSANWQCSAINASTRTWVTTSTAVSFDTWTELEIRANSTNALYYINGSLVANITTNIPTTTTYQMPLIQIRKTNGIIARKVIADYFTIDCKY